MNKKIKLIVVFFSVLFLFSCKQKEEKACCKMDNMESENKMVSGESVFNLESRWVKQNKDSMSLKDLSNKITVAAMVFTHCESACPRIISDIQRIEKAFSKEELENIQFLLVSMDPERDTPERFVEFSNDHKLNKNWICISSNEDATMEIANVLNVRIKKLSSGGFDHSNTIHLLDKNGDIVFQQNGLAQNPDEMISKIKELLK
jgi:protein SCO1/2